MKSVLLLAIASIAINALPTQTKNKFGDLIKSRIEARPATCDAKLAELQDLDELSFANVDLFYLNSHTVCTNREIVNQRSKELVDAGCPQPIEKNNTFQTSSAYLAWSNSETSTVACNKYTDQGQYCLNEIARYSGGWKYGFDLEKEKLCTDCQREFWNTVTKDGGDVHLAPQLYFSTISNRDIAIETIKGVCGDDFFDTNGLYEQL